MEDVSHLGEILGTLLMLAVVSDLVGIFPMPPEISNQIHRLGLY